MRVLIAALLGGVAIAAAAPVSASPGFLEEIGEWVASCDNTGSCSLHNSSAASQRRTMQPSQFGLSRICLHRRAGANSAVEGYITLIRPLPPSGRPDAEPRRLRLVGGGAPSDAPLVYRSASHWEFPFGRSAGLLDSFLTSSEAEIIAPDGRVDERLPLDRLREAMARIDTARQEMKPSRPESLVTAPIPAIDPMPVPSPAALRLRQEACGSPGLDASRAYRLLGDARRADRVLWITPCLAGPASATTLFIVENADGSAEPMSFPGSAPERPTGRPGLLATAQHDLPTGRVREMWRAQGVTATGQACGIQRLWGWNGREFELAIERRTLSCAGIGTGYWPQIFNRGMILPATDSAPAVAAGFRLPC